MRLFILILMLIMPFVAMAETKSYKLPLLEFGPDDFGDIRGFIWGIKSDDVRKFEQGTFFDEVAVGKDQKSFFYLDNVMNGRTLIGYQFYKDQLWQAKFDFQKHFYDAKDSMDDFMKVQGLLDKRYGQASLDLKWINNTYRDFQDKWGLAVLRGDLIVTATWQNATTDTVMVLKSDDLKIVWNIVFTSRAIAPTVQKGADAAALTPQAPRQLP